MSKKYDHDRISTGGEPVGLDQRDVPSWLRERVGRHGSTAAVAVHDGEGWERVSAADLIAEIDRLSVGLGRLGVGPGDRVLVMGPTSAAWSRLDFAVMSAGAITVPIYPGSAESQCRTMLRMTQPEFAFVGASSDADTLRRIDPDLDIRTLDAATLDKIAGDPIGSDPSHVPVVDPKSVATVVFTSGTTGEPKGVPLTHEQLVWTARQAASRLDDVLGPGVSTLLVLPLAHIFARVVVLAALDAGVELAYGRSVDDVPDDLRSYRPTFLLVVPRLVERIISGGRRQAEGWRRPVFDWGVRTARRWSQTERRGPLLRLQHRIADLLVLRQLRAGLGGRVEVAVSGGARLDPALGHLLEGAGISVIEGYGLTETTGPATVSTPGRPRLGSVGRPIPGVEVRIADDDEVLVRGLSVTSGYLTEHSRSIDDLVKPDDSFDADGWFRTGDQGSLSADGHLSIVGRAKDLIVTDGGQNIAPVPLEDALTAHPAIEQAMVIGDGRPFVAALVVCDDGAPHDISERRQVVQDAVDEANAAVGPETHIREFRIVDRAFDDDHGELTPTQKLRRGEIVEHFAGDVADIYDRQR
jgi:long-chain acyl-CoA synthetase